MKLRQKYVTMLYSFRLPESRKSSNYFGINIKLNCYECTKHNGVCCEEEGKVDIQRVLEVLERLHISILEG